MKVRPPLVLLLILTLMTSKANADDKQEEISSDFLEFLADMEEVTGDGFENWLETYITTEVNSEIDSSNTKEQ